MTERVGIVDEVTHSNFKFIQGQEVVSVDSNHYRPSELKELIGDASKAHLQLGWRPRVSLKKMIEEMLNSDLEIAKKEMLSTSNDSGTIKYFSD